MEKISATIKVDIVFISRLKSSCFQKIKLKFAARERYRFHDELYMTLEANDLNDKARDRSFCILRMSNKLCHSDRFLLDGQCTLVHRLCF